MEMSKGEIFDRWTILRMKARFDDGAKAELDRFQAEVTNIMTLAPDDVFDGLLDPLAQLAEANGKIWITEAAIRREYSDDPSAKEELSLEEVGKRALEIRGYNKLRVEAKAVIDAAFGGVPDVKVDHASQESAGWTGCKGQGGAKH